MLAKAAQHARMPAMRERRTAVQAQEHALRDLEVLRRYESGETLAAIGARVRLSRERVRQIVMASGAAMPWDYKCAVEGCTTSPRTPNRYCKEHQRRFELRGDPLGLKARLMDQHGTVACYKQGRCRCDLCRKANADQRLEYLHRTHPEMRYKAAPEG
jgi:hypothetical protein